MWLCRNRGNDLYYSCENEICFASKKIESYTETQRNKPDYKPEKDRGRYYYAVPHTASGGPLPSRRDYYEGLAKERN